MHIQFEFHTRLQCIQISTKINSSSVHTYIFVFVSFETYPIFNKFKNGIVTCKQLVGCHCSQEAHANDNQMVYRVSLHTSILGYIITDYVAKNNAVSGL